MKKIIALVLIAIPLLLACSDETKIDDDIDYTVPEDNDSKPEGGDSKPGDDNKVYVSFLEEFNNSTSEYFRHSTGGKGADFTWNMGVVSPSEAGAKILSFKIDPEEVAGAGMGPEIVSRELTFYGTYAARLKVPDAKEIQPNVGAVVGYFTYLVDSVHGQSEIDFEWLIADPEIIHIGTWTGSLDNSRRIGRTINMREGVIYDTSYRERDGSNWKNLTGEQNQPEKIDAIENYDASSQFYTYGFDWYLDRIQWWMLHPISSDKIVLWDYRGSSVGIPATHSRFRMNFWHTDNWAVQTNPNSIEKPIFPFELEVDWMSYTSIDDSKNN